MSKSIRIENPVSGPGFTTANRANRFIRDGQAAWAVPGVAIRFLRDPRNHRDRSVSQNASPVLPYWYERAAHAGIALESALAMTPVTSPAIALGRGKLKGASRYTFLAAQGCLA